MGKSEELDWDDLRYFLRALQSKTLSGAGRTMGVDNSTIGRRLSALERALGAPLVLRSPDGLKLTPLGERLAPLVEEVERAIHNVRDLVASERRRVRLAVPSGFTKFFTARFAQLRTDHPELSLELVSGARPVDLMKGEADLAIRSGPVADKELVSRKLCDSGWSLYASEAYLARRAAPSDPNDLSGHEIIGYDASLAGVPAAKWVEERSSNATIVLRSREMTDMVAAAVSGVGLALLPCTFDDEPGLRRLTDEVFATRAISLVYRREARLSDEVRAVIRFAVEVMRQNADHISGTRASR